MNVNIRIWNGCRVVGVIGVDESGASTSSGAAGGAANSARVDIEIDPWANLLVDNRPAHFTPIDWIEVDTR